MGDNFTFESKQGIDMKRLVVCSLLISTLLAVSGCGGGSAASENSGISSDQLTLAQKASNVNDPSEMDSGAVKFHSTDAFVWNGTSEAKSAARPSGIRKVALETTKRSAIAKTSVIHLGSPPADELLKLARNNQRNGSLENRKAHQIGFARPTSSSALTKSAPAALTWSTLANGNSLGTVGYESTDAVGLRIGVVVTALPANAVIYALGANESTNAIEISGAEINQAIAANVLADGDSAAARTYWLPNTHGATVQLAIELPAGTSTAAVSIAVPSLIHMVKTAPQASVEEANQKSNCPSLTPDVTCTVPLPPAANAVNSYDFVSGGGSYSCTGTLVADKASSGTPYMLTANHCISNQTAASSITSYWFYRSSACNSSTVNPGYLTTYGGGTLLFSQSDVTANTRNPVGTDTSFLRLNTAPPAGVMYVGWTNNRQPIASSPSLIAIHSPESGYLRQSTGTVSGMAYVNSVGSLFSTSDVSQPMYRITWSSGITEGGSSGSGIFLDGTTSNPKIVGQLWGGSSSCTAPNNPDYYGRFDLAYQNGMINWLNPGYQMVFRFFNNSNGAHFFSANVAERDSVRINNLALGYEGPVFSVASAPGAGLSPVYRFYNTSNGAHFYTIDEGERASILANAPWYRLEGVAWYARQNANPGAGSIPVYRFYVKSLGTHLYTVSASERDYIIQNLGFNYNYEGVAYQAWNPS